MSQAKKKKKIGFVKSLPLTEVVVGSKEPRVMRMMRILLSIVDRLHGRAQVRGRVRDRELFQGEGIDVSEDLL